MRVLKNSLLIRLYVSRHCLPFVSSCLYDYAGTKQFLCVCFIFRGNIHSYDNGHKQNVSLQFHRNLSSICISRRLFFSLHITFLYVCTFSLWNIFFKLIFCFQVNWNNVWANNFFSPLHTLTIINLVKWCSYFWLQLLWPSSLSLSHSLLVIRNTKFIDF